MLAQQVYSFVGVTLKGSLRQSPVIGGVIAFAVNLSSEYVVTTRKAHQTAACFKLQAPWRARDQSIVEGVMRGMPLVGVYCL